MGYWVTCPHCHKSVEINPGGGKRRNFDKAIETMETKVPFSVSLNILRLKSYLLTLGHYSKMDYWEVLKACMKYPEIVNSQIDAFMSDNILRLKGTRYLVGMIAKGVSDAKYSRKRP